MKKTQKTLNPNKRPLLRFIHFHSIILAFAITTTIPSCSIQTNELAQIDNKLANLMHKIDEGTQIASQAPNYDVQPLENANDNFAHYLITIGKNTQLLSYPLKEAKQSGLTIATAPDNLVRCYSWDTQTGGTMHFFRTVVQYKCKNGTSKAIEMLTRTTEEDAGDPGWSFDSIHLLQTKSGQKVYLITGLGIYSTMYSGCIIQAYTINNNDFKPIPFFQTKKSCLKEISYSGSGNIPQIEFTDQDKTLLIPIITKDGISTKRNLIYKFNGEKFVFQP